MYKILRDKYLRVVFAICFFIYLAMTLFVSAKFFNVSGPLIVHFDVFKGIDAIGEKREIFGILAMALAMLGINFFLAEFIYQRERFMSYLLSFATLVLSILFLAVIIVISSVNL